MVDAGTNDFQGVIHVCKVKEGFTLDVGFGDIEGVEIGRVIVEDTKKVVVVAD